jgi:hypothetical protein
MLGLRQPLFFDKVAAVFSQSTSRGPLQRAHLQRPDAFIQALRNQRQHISFTPTACVFFLRKAASRAGSPPTRPAPFFKKYFARVRMIVTYLEKRWRKSKSQCEPKKQIRNATHIFSLN